MKKTFSEQELIELAEKRIKLKRGLYSHIAAYVIINLFLFFIYYFTDRTYPWFLWPLARWTIGLAFHSIETIQELNFKLNANAVNKELEKIRKHINSDNIDK